MKISSRLHTFTSEVKKWNPGAVAKREICIILHSYTNTDISSEALHGETQTLQVTSLLVIATLF